MTIINSLLEKLSGDRGFTRDNIHKNRQGRRPRRKKSSFSYDQMESRQLMAALPLGATLEGDHTSGTQVDTHWIYANRNDAKIQFSISKTGGHSQYIPRVEVFDQSNNRIHFKETNTFRTDDLTLPSIGHYIIKVSSKYNNFTGSYAIGAERLNGVSNTFFSLPVGHVIEGKIDNPLQINQTLFYNGAENARVDLSVFATPTQGDFKVWVDLVSPSGNRVANFLRSNSSAWFTRQVTLDEVGHYKLHVHDDNFRDQGTYRVGIEGLSPMSPNSIPVTRGAIVTADIDGALEQKQYRFWAAAGHNIQLAIDSVPAQAGFLAFAEVTRQSGNPETTLDFSLSNGRSKEFTVSETGFHTILLRDKARKFSGQARLSFTGINPTNVNALGAAVGMVRTGQIADPISRVQYTFPAKAHDRFQLVVKSQANQIDFRAIARVYSPIGELVGSLSAFSEKTEFTVLHEGRYVIQFEDFRLSKTGSFSFSLEGIQPMSPNSMVLPFNQTVSSQISHPIDHRQFRFWVGANQTFHVDLRGGSNPPGRGGISDGIFRASYELIAPNGSRSGPFYGNSIRTFNSNNGGTGMYTVMVMDDYFDATGSFTIRRF